MTDENDIEVKPKRTRKASKVECITLRKIGLDDRTSEVGETVKLPREIARKLQDSGAIKVVI